MKSSNSQTPSRRAGRYRSALGAAIIALAVTGCSSGQPQTGPAPDPSPSPVATPAPSEPAPYPFHYPLTGLGTNEAADSRPLMVMVENSPQARPQTGLDQADIVFEILAEGEITRFAAVYHSQNAKVIGPVRSLRPYYAELGEGLDAYIVHAGWSQDAINYVNSRKLAHFDQVYGDDAYYWRDNNRVAPHNLYTSVEKIREGSEKKKYRQDWKAFKYPFMKKDDEATGEKAEQIKVNYIHGYYVTYEYDAEAKLYKRSMAGEPHRDKESEVQLTAANIIIAETKHQVLDNEGRRRVDVNGPGKGMLIQGGKKRDITWERKDGTIRVYDKDRELPLMPGQTWIQVVPGGSEIEIEYEN
ncbi:DUF3048 domain-containing protein [Paenibacillus sp. J2TS4]|uniref:DUF3048 domain-containing protein n=1 Tax=Paenibacillus sp. J2TS4 TaxID=2807194 RepID=UPI001B10F942|nr:DUF3048 domain-containing protein [Paenibacillus sp. J2TS4]GIP33656.1 putative lipoprotein YerB [Paenibacillus sp. J2TS4]